MCWVVHLSKKLYGTATKELAPNEATQNEGNEESIQREANEEFTSNTPGAIGKSYDWMNQPLYTVFLKHAKVVQNWIQNPLT